MRPGPGGGFTGLAPVNTLGDFIPAPLWAKAPFIPGAAPRCAPFITVALSGQPYGW